ncbi:MAG: D-alanyl-D-alanine carboxypeptidase (penicillin-binding protein 4)-like protein [Frankiales bacterium]|nr:D-alanyl-D-alanine carboxypeptidase (penicillin-binding protein 4)-like protein [Frankiales bacterium]
MRRWWVAGLGLVVLLAGVTGATVLRDTGAQLPGSSSSPQPSPEPSRTPLLAPASATARVPTAAGLRAALATALKDPALGRRLALSVRDASTGRTLLEIRATASVTPASTAKIVTALAALTVLRPDARLTTRVLRGAPGDVVLVGGGDPLLAGRWTTPGFPARARLADLAAQLKGVAVRRVVVDDGLFTGPRLGPGWKPGYVTHGDVAPVSALAADGGRTSTRRSTPRTQDPALEAGRQLAALLKARAVVRGAAPAGATELAHVESAPVSDLVEAMLTRSDNDVAEALGRHVALASGEPATFTGAAAALGKALGPLLAEAGLTPAAVTLVDASGLSVLSRLQPTALTRLLALVGQDPRYAAVLTGLPVGGFDGTLAKRYRTGPAAAAAGSVRAKTGTLNGVSALAGLVRTRDGRLLAFDATADGVSLTGTLQAQAALDRLAARLAACGCT